METGEGDDKTLNYKIFNVKVSDEISLEDFNYKIYIHKRYINTSHQI